ncbi:hypothetical protein WMF30_53050 [Sorangium sp. So ce134]
MKAIARKHLVFLVMVPLALSACGGDGEHSDGGTACAPVAACGGDPTGSWTMADWCIDSSQFGELVPGCDADVDLSGVEMSGSAEFRPDGTYTETAALRGPMTVVYPPSCFSREGVATTCAQFDAALKEGVAKEGSLYGSAECVAAGEDCACNVSYRETTTTTRSGTWSVAGTILTTVPEGRGRQEMPFCVQGSSLVMGIDTAEEEDTAGSLKYTLRYTKN